MSKHTSNMNMVESKSFFDKFFAEGGKIYAIIRSVSKSGMSRYISFIGFKSGDSYPYFLTHHMSNVMNIKCYTVHGMDALKISGVGADMAFMTVYRVFGEEVANDRSKYVGIL